MAALQSVLIDWLVAMLVLFKRRITVSAVALGLTVVVCGLAIVAPLLLTALVSFWQREMFAFRPGFSMASYMLFFEGARFSVFRWSIWIAASATVLMLAIAYCVAYCVTFKLSQQAAKTVLFLLSVPFLVNYVVRTLAWTYLLGRGGPVNILLQRFSLSTAPIDWLLFSHFAVYLGLVAAYMPFMVYPIWLSLKTIDRRLLEAAWTLGDRPTQTFVRVILPLSLPGVSAAAIFGFVGAFGETAVSQILGGVGYQLMGNAIISSLDVMNYPLAAAMSTVTVACMMALLLAWLTLFDLRLFLGKILGR